MLAFKTIRSTNRELMTIQDNIRDALAFMKNATIVDGLLIGPFTITTANTVIPHTLNRMPLGWFPVRKKTAGDVFEVMLNDANLTLKTASGSVTSYFWVF